MSECARACRQLATVLPKISSQHLKINNYRFCQVRSIRLYKERTVRAMYWRSRSFDAVKFALDRKDQRQEWNYRSEIFAFSRRLQENLSEDTLRQVFAHPSYIESYSLKQTELNMPEINLPSNKELVDRGRELLELCTKPYLRYTFSRVPEDGIECIHKYLESELVMSDISKWLGCRDIILSTDWPPSSSTMADTVFAVLGGIEKDLGFDRVRRFAIDMILTYLVDKDIMDDVWIIPNPEITLAAILKNSKLPPYEPRILFQTGVKTLEPCHIVGLYVNKRLIGSSAGETLEIAENCASTEALRRIFDLTNSREPMIFGEKTDSIKFNNYSEKHNYIDSWKFSIDELTQT